jgi:hypothetical protein
MSFMTSPSATPDTGVLFPALQHRVRSRLIGQRTTVINQIRGFLLECGIPG